MKLFIFITCYLTATILALPVLLNSRDGSPGKDLNLVHVDLVNSDDRPAASDDWKELIQEHPDYFGGKRDLQKRPDYYGGKRDLQKRPEYVGGKRDLQKRPEYVGGKRDLQKRPEYIGGKRDDLADSQRDYSLAAKV